MTPRSIHEMEISGRRLVIRADLNMPMKAGRVTDTTRIERFAGGLKPLLAKGASAVILSHLGRPDGNRSVELTLEPVAEVLGEFLDSPVAFTSVISGAAASKIAAGLPAGEVLVCENLRFDPREEANWKSVV